ncbi:hypothetical protein PSMK_25530 [Phycisphaera mikurensis NBRC 102666]|uniref:PrcB C-terminal domain-containing protein n=2 Tax=Phycisphaera TaxID=666508 RepID=I0IHH4_PHYMF|nr:hypothetical protein PSMK_25530 [Phycisphaera mikurensis NBRC 102666]
MRMHRLPLARPAASLAPSCRAAIASGLVAVSLALAGCGSTPAPAAEGVPHRDPASAGVADADATPREVPILRRTAASNGSPALYTLILIENPDELPGPVADALKPDFDNEAVVFFGMGEQPGPGYAAEITSVRRTGSELTVAADVRRPEEAVGGDPTTPWSAVVIERQPGVTMPLLSDFN